MSALVREAADRAADTTNWKERVHAAARALHMPFGRAKRLYYGEARRVDAEEMDRARAAIEELREAKLRRQAGEHIAWLNATVERLRQTDEEFHGFNIDGLERAVARLGASGGAVGDPGASDDDPSEFSD